MSHLTYKQLETHGGILSTVGDALVLKHQAIIIHSADKIFMIGVQFHRNISVTVKNIVLNKILNLRVKGKSGLSSDKTDT